MPATDASPNNPTRQLVHGGTPKRFLEEPGNYERGIQTVKAWVLSMHQNANGNYNDPKTWSSTPVIPLTPRSHASDGDSNHTIRLAVSNRNFPAGVQVFPPLIKALTSIEAYLQQIATEGRTEQVHYLVDELARMPGLVKTLLLIEDETMRKEVLSMPLMTMILLSKYSVENYDDPPPPTSSVTRSSPLRRQGETRHLEVCPHTWLAEMLSSSNTHLQSRLVDYLHKISKLKFQHFESIRMVTATGGKADRRSLSLVSRHKHVEELASIQDREMVAFRERVEELFHTVGNQRYFLPLLLALPDHETERASTTLAMKWIMTREIRDPLAVAVIFLDFVMQLMLLFTFRARFHNLYVDRTVRREQDNFRDSMYLTISMSIVSIVYFLVRFVSSSLAVFCLSKPAAVRHTFNAWTWVDGIGLALVVVAGIGFSVGDREVTEAQVTIAAVALGLLWLRLINFLQIMNKKLATYTLSILQILYDIGLFVLIIMVTVFAAGDVFYGLYASDPVFCPERSDSAVVQGFCQGTTQSYLVIYQAFLGQFEFEEFNKNWFTSLLFFLVTFFIILVLLNVLIAIVDESYERSMVQSERLFGRARIVLISKVDAFTAMIQQPDEDEVEPYSRTIIRHFVRNLTRLFVAMSVCLLGTLIVLLWWRWRVNKVARVIIIVLLAALLFYPALSVLVYLLVQKNDGGWLQSLFYASPVFRHGFGTPIRFLTLFVLGAHEDPTPSARMGGRLNHTDESIESSEERVQQSIADMYKRVENLESALRERDNQLRDQLGNIMASIQSLADSSCSTITTTTD